MLARFALRRLAPPALLILAATLTVLSEWRVAALAVTQPGDEARTETEPKKGASARSNPASDAAEERAREEDVKAIRAADDGFVAEYNRGDSKAVATRFTDDAEIIEADGDRYQGREVIERGFAGTLAASKGAKIAIDIDTIRFLSPDVAKEEGRSVVTLPNGAPVSRLYTLLYVKREGRWLVSSIREELDPLVRPHDRLKDLEWMIGEWVDEDSDAFVRVTCRWSEDKNFLIRLFTVNRRGKPVMSVTQRVGWDPQARQFRSWEFDSQGGFGEGKWSQDGERWVVKQSGVRPDGKTASATNITFRERPDMVRWISTERVLGDESIPENISYVLVRVPPQPQLGPKGQATPSPSPNQQRSPR